jgi:hypothetical protein
MTYDGAMTFPRPGYTPEGNRDYEEGFRPPKRFPFTEAARKLTSAATIASENPSFGILGSSRGRNPGGERGSLHEEMTVLTLSSRLSFTPLRQPHSFLPVVQYL